MTDLPACYDADVDEQTATGRAVLERLRARHVELGMWDAVRLVDELAQEIAEDHSEEA